MKKYRSFKVDVVNNGFIAEIGCQRLVFKTLIDVADALTEYWKDPDSVEKSYMENSIAFVSLWDTAVTETSNAILMDLGAETP